MSIKRFISFALAVFLVCLAMTVIASADSENHRLIDDAELLTEAEFSNLSALLDEASEEYGFALAVCFIDDAADYGRESNDDYVQWIIDEEKINVGERGSFAILFYSKSDDYQTIYTDVYGEGDMVNADPVFDAVKDDFEDHDYAAAGRHFVESYTAALTDLRENSSPNYGKTIKELDGEAVRYVDLDGLGLLTESEAKKLTSKLDRISEELQFDVVVAVVDDLHAYVDTEGFRYESYEAFADDFYDYYGGGEYGFGDEHDGAVLVYFAANDYRWLSTCGEGIDALYVEDLKDAVIGYFNKDDYYGAFSAFGDFCETQVLDYRSFHLAGKIIISVLIGLVIAAIITSKMKKQLTSVSMAREANNYVRPGSLNITESRDTFLYSHVTRTARESSSSGGGGGSHTSSSGRSHGGGGF